MVVDLKNYKVAKKYAEDSKSILRAFDLSIRALENFRTYKPVLATIVELKSNKAILEAHLRTAEKIIAQGKLK